MLASLTPIPFAGAKPAESFNPPIAATPPATGPGYSVLFERSPLPMWIFDAQSLRFIDVNDAALERFGWTREEFLTMTADAVCDPDGIAAFQDYRKRITRGEIPGQNTQPDWRHVTKSGELVPVQTAWQIIVNEGRRAILVTIMDRSEQERAEEENRELAEVLNLASDAIIVCDLERTVQFWNRGAEQIYGWTADDAIGRKADELFKLEPDAVFRCMTGLLESGEWRGEMKNGRKSGEQATVNSRWTLAREAQTGRPKSVLLINTDVTETKKLEAQFLRAQRLDSLGTLASGIAHDLNNILSPILMAAGILRTAKIGAENEKMIGIIEGSAERGAGIVKQVLTFARGAGGDRVPLQPKHLITDMAKVMVQTFPKNLDIQTQLPKDLWMITGDTTQIHQILLNLCVNARDAMSPKGGALTVACENTHVDARLAAQNPGAKPGPHVVFSVTDTGSGMTPEVMEKIFDPFFTTKEQGKGTGLGLATVIGIVKSHDGFITIQSKVGVGTTFRIFIPANVEAKAEVVQAIDPAKLRGNGEALLVVDDEATVREAIVTTLEGNGYRCFTAEDGTDALALYFERRGEIDGIITDLQMGMMDGLTLVRSLRKMTAGVKVIVSSGHIEDEKRATLGKLGVRIILDKPYSSEKLLRGVKSLLYPDTAKAA
jgi:two-component system, cell cycle sensor histidine kinase and response regulator CckA